MRTSIANSLLAGLFGIVCGMICTSSVQAAEPEVVDQHTRAFCVSVDGKPRGTQTMTFQRRNDGSEVVTGDAEVVMNFIVYRYRYASTSKEIWKDGRLIQLVNEADFNGDKYSVQGSAKVQSLHYEVNGESQKAPADVWVASYWREPEAKRVGQKVQVLDSHKGRQLTADLVKLEPEDIKVGEDSIKAKRYQMRGDVEVDVWYDKDGYIVRQHSVEFGHKTLLELTEIRKVADGKAETSIK